jgi:hypothetical protein
VIDDLLYNECIFKNLENNQILLTKNLILSFKVSLKRPNQHIKA